MPELPEVETIRLALDPVLTGQQIQKVIISRPDLRFPFPQNFQQRLEGACVLNTARRGKYMMINMDQGEVLIWHLGMSGRVKISDAYRSEKHDHVIFTMGSGQKIIFNDARRFGFMDLLPSETWEQKKPFVDMGPEPLSNNFHADALWKRLHKKQSSIKSALLDQAVVAGLGNIYVCEALYESTIHPEKKAYDLNRYECDQLAHFIPDVLKRALESGGSTLRDYKHTDGTTGYFQHSFAVYNREGEFCKKCDSDLDSCRNPKGNGCIKRIVQSGRSTFYCERTQK